MQENNPLSKISAESADPGYISSNQAESADIFVDLQL